jgi:hypothetical protein
VNPGIGFVPADEISEEAALVQETYLSAKESGLIFTQVRGITDFAAENAEEDFHRNLPAAMRNAADWVFDYLKSQG